jgi:hypothetical protein
MGPFADALGINTGVAFWLCVAQLPVMVGLALHYPTVRIDLFSTSIRVAFDPSTNQTVIAAANASAVEISSYEHGVAISGMYVLNAASFAFFAVMTMNFVERGVAAAASANDPFVGGGRGARAHTHPMAEEEFVAQNLGMLADPTFRAWNQAFTITVILVHSVVAATVCSPVSWDVVFTCVLLIYTSLGVMVQPMDNFDSESFLSNAGSGDAGGGLGLHASSSPAASPGGMAAIAAQGTMLRAGLCLLVVGYILLHIPLDSQSCKSQFVLLLACLDGLMLFGHLWDRVPTLQVVLNCRMLYVCLLALFNTAMFLTWRDCTAVSYLRAAASAPGAAAAASVSGGNF